MALPPVSFKEVRKKISFHIDLMIFLLACNSSFDYSYNYSKCINGQRTKQYVWIEPASCNKNNSVLPPSVVEPCGKYNFFLQIYIVFSMFLSIF